MSIDTSKPVRLKRAPEMVGKITSVGRDRLSIVFDGGGSGQFTADDVEQADPDTQPEDKSWPPKNLERK